MKDSTNNNGIGFLGLLTIVFITLKLTKVIDWSWWWVLSPIWIPTVLIFTGLLVYLLIGSKKSKPAESKFQTRMREEMERQRALNKK